jgi:hypothetical protein
MPTDEQRAADLARAFHEAYERLAPSFGYETRRESAAPWESVPDQNRALMTAVCAEVMAPLLASREAAARAGAVEDAARECERDAMGWTEEYRATEIEAAKDAIPGHPGLGAELARCECRSVRSALLDAAARIRITLAATPPDRVVVAREDLAVLVDVAGGVLDRLADEGREDQESGPQIRAALTRLGESDGR